MKWFDRWFLRKAKWAWENANTAESDSYTLKGSGIGTLVSALPPSNSYTTPTACPGSTTFRSKPVSVNIYDADGGKIIEFYRYDGYDTNLIVVGNHENFGERFEAALAVQILSKN